MNNGVFMNRDDFSVFLSFLNCLERLFDMNSLTRHYNRQ
jgi:hypothetical protein